MALDVEPEQAVRSLRGCGSVCPLVQPFGDGKLAGASFIDIASQHGLLETVCLLLAEEEMNISTLITCHASCVISYLSEDVDGCTTGFDFLSLAVVDLVVDMVPAIVTCYVFSMKAEEDRMRSI